MHAVRNRLRSMRSGDEGSSLIAVIGISAVIAVVMVTLVGSVVFAVGQTTASRSSVNAKSSAEAGIETAAAQVSGGVCWVGGAGSSTSPHWKAQVQKLTSPTANLALESSWTNGCPIAAPAGGTPTPFRVISTGYSGTPGAGNTSGDVRTMVGQFTVIQRPSSPEFDQAIFGDVMASASTNLVVSGAGADVLTKTFNCSTHGNMAGGVYINSSLSETSTLNTDCQVGGDLVTKGNLTCPSKGKIHGSVIVAGNVSWNTECETWGDMWVGGNFDCPASAIVHGNLTVVGNASFATGCNITGNIYVGGKLSVSNTYTYPGSIWAKELSGNSGITITSGGSVRIKTLSGGITAAKIIATPKTIPDASLPTPAAPDMSVYFPPGDPSLVFPKISITDSRWSGWTMHKWRLDTEPLRTASWIDVCNVSSSPAFSGALTVVTPTIYDLTQASTSGGCGSSGRVGLGGALTIKLAADMVMFVPGAQFQSLFRVESLDGAKHSLYLIESWPTSATSCSSMPSSIRGIDLNAWGASPSISQGPNTQIMVYTPGSISASGQATVTGQFYGCKVDLSNPVTLNYVAATSSGGSAGRAFVVTERFRMDDQALELH